MNKINRLKDIKLIFITPKGKEIKCKNLSEVIKLWNKYKKAKAYE